MSVSPDDPLNLPYFRRPPEFQGTGKDPVWSLTNSDVGPDLEYRNDPNNADHGFIEPARPMTLESFQLALTQLQTRWRKMNP